MTTSLFKGLRLIFLNRKKVGFFKASTPSLCRSIHLGRAVTMANFKFSYVRSFEKDDKLPPQQWIVISLENLPNGSSELFLKSANSRENYTKLITTSSLSVMDQFKDITVTYFHFNKIHFIFNKDSTVYQRRGFKLLTYLCSCLTSSFVRNWSDHFTEDLQELPIFDGSIHLLPNDQLLRDHFTMHQLAHHRVNLKQTLHLAIQEQKLLMPRVDLTNVDGSTNKEILKDIITSAPTTLLEVPENQSESYYNEVLFSDFGVNYNNEPDVYKKGCVLLRQKVTEESAAGASKIVSKVLVKSADFRQKSFWLESNLLNNQTSFNAKCTGLQKFAVGELLLLHAWVVVRIDGKAFHKLSKDHKFDKPNDLRAINLMNISAAEVMKQMPDIVFGFGESDEYSFVVNRYSKPAVRYSTSLVTQCVSLFTSAYVSNWPKVFNSDKPLQYGPMFDGRAVLYPTNTSLRDYLSWRQADCHINNMYNTVFWKLIQMKGLSNQESEKMLNGTFSADKRRIMLGLGFDYDQEPAIHRKGSILYRIPEEEFFPTDVSLVSHNCVIEKSKSGSKMHESNEKPWWDSDCEVVKMQRKSVRKKCQLQPTLEHFQELKACEELAKKVFKTAKQNFMRQSNINISVPLVKPSSCSQCGSSDLSLVESLTRSRDVNLSTRNRSLSENSTMKKHDAGASGLALREENGGDSLPTGFDKRGNPWWNVECHMAKVARSAAKSAFMKNPDASTDTRYKECEADLKAAIRSAKREFKKLADSLSQKSNTESNKTCGNSHPISEVTLNCSSVIKEDLENVEELNGFLNNHRKNEMFASTLREGLSTTPAMPSGVHDELHEFAHSLASQLQVSDNATSKSISETDDVLGKYANGVGGSTLMPSAQTSFSQAMDRTEGSISQKDGALDEAGVASKTNDDAFLLGNAIISDSGYSSALLTESTREYSDQVTEITSIGSCKKPVGGDGEYKEMGNSICLCHVDIIKDDFWNRNPHILGQEKSALSFNEDC